MKKYKKIQNPIDNGVLIIYIIVRNKEIPHGKNVKEKFIRLVMSAANEVVKHFSEGTKTIEAEIPSGTKTELVSIVVSGRRGWYETFHGIKRMPVFISTRLTLNGAQGEIVFWGNDVPPELRDLTAKELSKKGYQIGPCAADDRPFANWVRSFAPWQSEFRDFLEEELGKEVKSAV